MEPSSTFPETPDSWSDIPAADYQKHVDDYFESTAEYWKDIYQRDTRLLATIYRQRSGLVLRWISELGLQRGARVLEVGCGAGLTTAAVAGMGYMVQAVDPARAMIESTRSEAAARELSDRVAAQIGDVHHLAFKDGFFDLVIAIGVIPWLHSEFQACAEMARATKPGGFLIASADNRLCLTYLLDPWSTPLIAPLRKSVKRLLRLLRLWSQDPGPFYANRHSPGEIDRLISTAGFRKLKSTTLGFGPFSFCGMNPISDSAGVRLHTALQRLAGLGLPPGLRSAGNHYVVLAEKSSLEHGAQRSALSQAAET